MVPLKIIFFYTNDVPLKPSMKPEVSEAEDCNLGTEEDPQMVKLSKTLSPAEKEEYIQPFRK